MLVSLYFLALVSAAPAADNTTPPQPEASALSPDDAEASPDGGGTDDAGAAAEADDTIGSPSAETAAPETPPIPEPPAATYVSKAEADETRGMVEALADEVTQIKENLAIPETEELRSQYGLGPAASKVYGVRRGLSLGGYGELYLGQSVGPRSNPDDPPLERSGSRGDTYRFILYTGYKFSDRIVMNTELEFEHASTGTNPENGKSGSIGVEFAYLDFLLTKWANVRAGLMLMPMGITNQMHEPTTYRGNFRPETERRIIPSTWSELGVGVFGAIPGGLTYKLYFVSGLSAAGFGDTGIRGGRQKGIEIAFEDKAAVAQLEWNLRDKLTIGGGGYFGGADQDKHRDETVRVWIAEGHVRGRFRGAEVSALFAINGIDGAAKADTRTPEQLDPMSPDYLADAVPKVVPSGQFGWYATGSYDVLNEAASISHELAPFVRFEMLDLNWKMDLDQSAKGSRSTKEITAGVDYKPHPQVVIKAEYSHLMSEGEHDNVAGDTVADAARKEIRIGAGFIF